MEKKPKEYRGKEMIIRYDSTICIHAAECVNGLAPVFEMGRKPWVIPDNGTPEEIKQVIAKCPSGALSCRPGSDEA